MAVAQKSGALDEKKKKSGATLALTHGFPRVRLLAGSLGCWRAILSTSTIPNFLRLIISRLTKLIEHLKWSNLCVFWAPWISAGSSTIPYPFMCHASRDSLHAFASLADYIEVIPPRRQALHRILWVSPPPPVLHSSPLLYVDKRIQGITRYSVRRFFAMALVGTCVHMNSGTFNLASGVDGSSGQHFPSIGVPTTFQYHSHHIHIHIETMLFVHPEPPY